MPSKNFFALLDKQRRPLAEGVNATIAHLTSFVQQHGEVALPLALSSLLQQTSYTVEIFGSLVCGRYAATGNTSTLHLFSHCPPIQNAFTRWATLAARLLAFTLYQETVGNLPVNVTWLIATDEQPEGESLRHELEGTSQGMLYDLPATLPLARPTVALGTKGLLSVDMEVKTSFPTQPTANDAILPNPVWRLLWALNSFKNAQEEILLEGFYDALTPMQDEEVELLRTYPDNELMLKQQLQTEDFLSHLHGFQRRYAHYLLPTCTITRIYSSSGTLEARHLLPSSARASLSMHLVPAQEPDDIYDKLRHHLDIHGFADVKTTLRASKKPQHSDLHNPFTQLVLENARSIYGEDIPILPLLPQSVPFDVSPLTVPTLYVQPGKPTDRGDEERFVQEEIRFLALVMEGMANSKRE